MQKWRRHFWIATLVAGLLQGAVAWGQSTGAAAPAAATKPAAATAAKPTAKVNLNTADETALTALKGIGEVKAKAILDYRQSNGPFKTVDDLAKVKGIGDKTVADLRDQLAVE
ncbi:MAG: ComEA family DNA-binding protein [Deltaproteobacteria bacterium]|nr:ComEA family DNA-binding protein [Deltaproteobacteria bacterium]